MAINFPAKIYQILENESSDILRWHNNGLAFRIIDHGRFEREIIPKYFRHNQLSSVQRQLNLYGFKCISRGEDKGAFFHPNFKRGEWDVVRKITRYVPPKRPLSVDGKFIPDLKSENTSDPFYNASQNQGHVYFNYLQSGTNATKDSQPIELKSEPINFPQEFTNQFNSSWTNWPIMPTPTYVNYNTVPAAFSTVSHQPLNHVSMNPVNYVPTTTVQYSTPPIVKSLSFTNEPMDFHDNVTVECTQTNRNPLHASAIIIDPYVDLIDDLDAFMRHEAFDFKPSFLQGCNTFEKSNHSDLTEEIEHSRSTDSPQTMHLSSEESSNSFENNISDSLTEPVVMTSTQIMAPLEKETVVASGVTIPTKPQTREIGVNTILTQSKNLADLIELMREFEQ